jgi:hypothetical protein
MLSAYKVHHSSDRTKQTLNTGLGQTTIKELVPEQVHVFPRVPINGLISNSIYQVAYGSISSLAKC